MKGLSLLAGVPHATGSGATTTTAGYYLVTRYAAGERTAWRL